MYDHISPVHCQQYYSPAMKLLSDITGVYGPPRYQRGCHMCPAYQRRMCDPRPGTRCSPMYTGTPACLGCPACSLKRCDQVCQNRKTRPENTEAENASAVKIEKSSRGWQQVIKLPGFTPEDVKVKIDQDGSTVQVRAKQKQQTENGYFYREVRRNFPLPKDMDVQQVRAAHDPERGLLVLRRQQTENSLIHENEHMRNAVELKVENPQSSQASDQENTDKEECHATWEGDKPKDGCHSVPIFIGFNPWTGRMVLFRGNQQSKESEVSKDEFQEDCGDVAVKEDSEKCNTSCESVNIEAGDVNTAVHEIDEPKQSETAEEQVGTKQGDITVGVSLVEQNFVHTAEDTSSDEQFVPSDETTDEAQDEAVPTEEKQETPVETPRVESPEPDTESTVVASSANDNAAVEVDSDNDFEVVEVTDAEVAELSENLPEVTKSSPPEVATDDSIADNTSSGFSVELNTAGFDPERIQVSLEGSTVTVSAQQETEEEDGVTVTRRFLRSLALPDDADSDRLQCQLDDTTGKLRLSAPQKSQGPKHVQIQIQNQ